MRGEGADGAEYERGDKPDGAEYERGSGDGAEYRDEYERRSSEGRAVELERGTAEGPGDEYARGAWDGAEPEYARGCEDSGDVRGEAWERGAAAPPGASRYCGPIVDRNRSGEGSVCPGDAKGRVS